MSNLDRPIVEGLDKLSSDELDIVKEFVRSALATKQIAEETGGEGPTTEELELMMSGCIGGKCTVG